VEEFRQKLPAGMTLQMRGQSETMRHSFQRLGFGLVFAILSYTC